MTVMHFYTLIYTAQIFLSAFIISLAGYDISLCVKSHKTHHIRKSFRDIVIIALSISAIFLHGKAQVIAFGAMAFLLIGFFMWCLITAGRIKGERYEQERCNEISQ